MSTARTDTLQERTMKELVTARALLAQAFGQDAEPFVRLCEADQIEYYEHLDNLVDQIEWLLADLKAHSKRDYAAQVAQAKVDGRPIKPDTPTMVAYAAKVSERRRERARARAVGRAV